jgi:hypothetical protein
MLRTRMSSQRRLLRILACACLAAVLPGSARAAGDLQGALARLSSPAASDRALAEREVAALAGPADAPLLASAAKAAGAEARSRIASALKSDGRHFGLAAALAAWPDPAAASVGDEALAGQAAAWLGASDQEPLPLASVERELRGEFSSHWRLELAGRGLEETLDRIARLVDARRESRPGSPAPALVLDPDFDPESARPLAGAEELGSVVTGGFEELVYAAAVSHGAFFDIYGWEEGRTWIVVRDPRATTPTGGRPAQALLRAWVRAVERPSSPAAGLRAARALASTGWPAALLWLDRRWSESGDESALSGLVLAAGRGGLTPSLASPKGAELLLQRFDLALSQGATRGAAAQWARAVLAMGGLGSESWAPGFGGAGQEGRLLRCALVRAARRCPADLAVALTARLSATGLSPAERCAILLALAAATPTPDPSGTPAPRAPIPAAVSSDGGLTEAFEWAASHGLARELAAGLRALGIAEPVNWNDAARLSAPLLEALFSDALARGEADPQAGAAAGLRLRALLGKPEGELRALALLDRESLWTSVERLRAALSAARTAGAEAALVLRLSLCAGLANSGEAQSAVSGIMDRPEWSPADWRAMGAFVARPAGALAHWPDEQPDEDAALETFLARLDAVRDALLDSQGRSAAGQLPSTPPALAALDAGWVQGVTRALVLLRAAQQDPGARELLRNLRLRFQRVRHPFRAELMGGRIPPPSEALLKDLTLREPWLGY